MNIVETTVFAGPSLHARTPAIYLSCDFDSWTGRTVASLGGRFREALTTLSKDLGIERPIAAEDDEAANLGHLMVALSLALQRWTGALVDDGTVISSPAAKTCWLCYGYETRRVGIEAGTLALDLIDGMVRVTGERADAPAPHLADKCAWFRAFAEKNGLHPDIRHLLAEATALDIPATPLENGYVLFGQGKRQRLIRGTMTDATGFLAVQFAGDDKTVERLLLKLGLPVFQKRAVDNRHDATTAAEAIGYPVVVKPPGKDPASGVGKVVDSAKQLIPAFDEIRRVHRHVVVETHVAGRTHRLLVIGGKMAAAARCVPASVIGDGVHTVGQLVDAFNREWPLVINSEARALLGQYGYTVEAVPAAGEQVALRRSGDPARGGIAVDVTDEVHPDVRDAAVLAADAIGLDVAGVDFVSTDICRSYTEVGGAIRAVNSRPSLQMHRAPARGAARNVARPLLDHLFPPGTSARIPIAAVTGTNGKTTTCRMLAHILRRSGLAVGLASSAGTYVDDHRLNKLDSAGAGPARRLLRDRRVDAAVLETARGALVRFGLGFDCCNVAAVLNVTNDHLGQYGIRTLDQMARIKRLVVESARDAAVLNADDPRCLAMREHVKGPRVWLVSRRPDHPEVANHVVGGGAAVVLTGNVGEDVVELHDGARRTRLFAVANLPATFGGLAVHNLENAMFAAALAFGMGMPIDTVRQGLQEFHSSYEMNPGRFNFYEGHPFRVFFDYAHNEAGFRAICDVVHRLEVEGRRICAITMAGDRSEDQMVLVAGIVAPHFDRFVCFTSSDLLRGRRIDEIPAILRAALAANGIADENIEVVLDEKEAIDATLRSAQPGDLVALLNTYSSSETWARLTRFRPRP
jgi:cyanophycin synthetase